jgi:hypothetical protein
VSFLTRFGFGFGSDAAFVLFAVFLVVDFPPLLVAAALGRPTEANPRKTWTLRIWRYGAWNLDLTVGLRMTELADLAKTPGTNRDVAERPMEKIMMANRLLASNYREI